MSHKSVYEKKITDLPMFKRTLDRLGVPYTENCTVKLYGSQSEKAALGFKLPGWRYEIAVTEKGNIVYDHFGSQANTMEHLGRTIKEYNQGAILMKANFNQDIINTSIQQVKGGTKLVLEFA